MAQNWGRKLRQRRLQHWMNSQFYIECKYNTPMHTSNISFPRFFDTKIVMGYIYFCSSYSSCVCDNSELIGKLEPNSALSLMGYNKAGLIPCVQLLNLPLRTFIHTTLHSGSDLTGKSEQSIGQKFQTQKAKECSFPPATSSSFKWI